MYDYLKAMKEDIKNYLKENQIEIPTSETEEFKERLNDELWDEDDVTGNGSTDGYSFADNDEMKEYVTSNVDLCKEALKDFCTPAKTIVDRFLSGEWYFFDATIRCYLLSQAIDESIDELTA